MEAASETASTGDNAGNTEDSGDATDSGDGPPASGFESPEAAFAAMQQGLKEHDWGAAVATLTPESREGMTMGMLFAGGMMAAFGGEETAGIAAVFEKHGVEMEEPSISFSVGPAEGEPAPEESTEFEPAEMPEIEDQIGFLTDMFTALEAMDSSGPGPDAGLAQWTGGELTDLTIEGDTASATMVTQTEGGEQSEAIEFRRGDSGWLVHLGDNLLEMGPGAGGPMAGGGFAPGEEGPSGPLAEAVLEDGLTSSIELTLEQPFQFFGQEVPDGALYATLNLVGDVIFDTYEYGEFQVVAAEDDTGATLELAAPVTNDFDNEFGEKFIELNPFFLDQKNTLPIQFVLTPPGEGAERLASLELSVKLKVREAVVVDDVMSHVGGTVDVEDVGELTISKWAGMSDGSPDYGLMIKGPSETVQGVTLLDGEGTAIDPDETSGFGGQFGIYAGEEFPEDTRMRIAVGGTESIKVVPLKFEDLELTR
jgi:hypothetical protein